MMNVSRRQFLRHLSAGSALVVVPSFLFEVGCATHQPELPGIVTAPTPDDPFLTWFGIDEAQIARLMAELTARGADTADLYFQYSRSTNVTLEDGIVSRASSSIDQGVGMRVVVGGQTGYAFTEDLSMEAMLGAAKTATAIAHGGRVAPPTRFTRRKEGTFYTLNVPWSTVGIDQKLPVLRKAEAYTKGLDPRISRVSIGYSDVDEKVLIANLAGQLVVDDRPMTRLFVSTVATQNGQTQSGYSNVAGRRGIDWYTDERLKTVAQEAVDRTVVLFDARRPPAGEMPVALAAGASGILLHEAVGHGMEADFNRKGLSIYANMIGQPVAERFINIVDDGTVEGERGALNYDDEGNPCEKTYLVQGGILTSYLHDQISAKHYGLASTGSGRRESFRFPPMPRMRCTYMEDGPHSRDEIIASIDRGIIAETFTNGQVDIGGGDFTFYIKNGWMVEGGKLSYPIKDCNIIGNGPEALKRVTMAANDAALDTGGWTCGKDGQGVPVSQGLPTVLVSSLTVGGDNA